VTGALWLPLSGWQKDPASAVERLPKDKIVYLHCASGKRCLVVADLLEKQGFPSGSVRPIKPGYRDLIGAGFSSEP
jgi:rhodanese-related sulfurtransferase